MPVGQAQMPLFDHLDELRRRLTVIVVSLLVATVGLYLVSSQLILLLIRPVAQYITGEAVESLEELTSVLVVLKPFDGFTLRFWVAFVFAILFTCPIWIWQVMAFFLPALTPRERRWVVPTFFVAVLLFATGMVFCYFVILSSAFEWMLAQTTGFSQVVANAPEYINTILVFEVAFGIAFELPLAVFYLTVFNIIPYKKLRESWRVVYIVLLVICATVTPDASPITMVLMFVPMIVLYEASLLVSRLVLSRRIARLKKEGLYDEDEDEDDDE